MKVSKEFKIGLAVILSTALLIFGVNYLKGNSFFGGDDVYYAYFPTSGALTPSSSVTLNGVEIGKVMTVDLVNPNNYTDPNKRVLVKFNVHNEGLSLAKGSGIKIVPGVLSTGVQIEQNFIAEEGYYEVGDTMDGSVSQEITEQIESELLPIKRKMENLITSIDNIVNSITVFWDTSAAHTLDQGLNEVKIAISRFGRVAYNIDNMILSEKAKLGRIFDNVENITHNFKETNTEIQKVVGNMGELTDTLLTADFKSAIGQATVTMKSLNSMLEDASEGNGTLGKLLKDEQLYNELNETNERLQILVDDIKAHPERYIHVSVFGAKTKGVPISKDDERKLKDLLDSIP
ncbi:MlaD family protein [Brumimicrobium aurantiacum]|uniref:MCE family protein n=1 Tax=Brumimicrobium aurantiacum TaxID=1737063 RepID=A0A3E1EWS8_9FLAO|nr:MlaD family protein [Brumimicrobium aurantiacum]RFC53943.1 MCE family protein [Brumimicrobium aurantiacum]